MPSLSKKILLIFSLLTLTECLIAFQYDVIKIFVNDRVITSNEIEVRVLREIKGILGNSSDASQVEEVRKKVISDLINEALIDIRADELMIDIREEEIEAEIEKIRNRQNISLMSFEDMLDEQQITIREFKLGLNKKLRNERVINREIRSSITIDEKKLKTEYEADSTQSMKIKARHILLRLAKEALPEEEMTVRSNLLKIKTEIESGLDFSEAAIKYSQDPSVNNNQGVLGYFGKKDMVAEFSKVAFELPLNQISDPVRTVFGLHLIEVLDKKADSKEPFENVKEKWMQVEYQKEFEKKINKFLADLKSRAKIITKK